MKKALYNAFLVILSTAAVAQQAERTVPADNDRQAGVDNDGPSYWNEGLKIVSYRLPPPPVGYQPEFKDLDGDGDTDVLLSMTIHDTPVMWIADEDDMTPEAWDGDKDRNYRLIIVQK